MGGDSAIRIEYAFSAPVDRVFRAWTDPRDLERWAWGSLGDDTRAEVDLRVGGDFRVSTQRPDGSTWSFTGTYTEIVSSRKLVHGLSWHPAMPYESEGEEVTVVFAPEGEKTKITFVHTGVPAAEARAEHIRGWTNTFETLEALFSGDAG